MKPDAEDCHVLYRLIVAVKFGCLVLVLFGCQNRTATTGSNPQKDARPEYSNNVVDHTITTNPNQYIGGSGSSTAFTSEQQEKNEYGPPMVDATITRSISAALRMDPQLAPFNFEVATVNGEVTLKGETSSVELRKLTERIAVAQNGVSKVNNFVRVTWNN